MAGVYIRKAVWNEYLQNLDSKIEYYKESINNAKQV